MNPELGTIILPVDRFVLTNAETSELLSAQSLAMADCAQEQGLELPWKPVEFNLGSSRLYGVWYRPEAERYGYGLPRAPEAPENEAKPPQLTDDDIATLERCGNTEEVKALAFDRIRPAFDYAEAFTGTSTAALESEEGRAVLEEWEACLNDAGLELDPAVSPFTIRGTGLDPTESNIRAALMDVTCKEQTNFVQRLAEIEAAIQTPIVEQYLPELTQMRQEYDDALENARAYLAANAP